MKVEKRIFTITEDERRSLIELTTQYRNQLLEQKRFTDSCDDILRALHHAKPLGGKRQVKMLTADWQRLVVDVLNKERRRLAGVDRDGFIGLCRLSLHIIDADVKMERLREVRLVQQR